MSQNQPEQLQRLRAIILQDDEARMAELEDLVDNQSD